MAKRKTDFSNGRSLNSGAWLVTFSDLIMLLLTFFVLLLTMSSMDTKLLKETFAHFKGGAPGVLELVESKEIDGLAEFITNFRSSEGLLVLDQDRIKRLLIPTEKSGENAAERVKKFYEQIKISDDDRGIVLSFQENVLFESGSVVIKEDAVPFLNSMAKAIESCSNDIIITGHTDGIPVKTGAYQSNWHLSLRRGLSVLEYLLGDRRLPPERFALGAYGAVKPLHPNNSPENRALNRRVEIIFKHL